MNRKQIFLSILLVFSVLLASPVYMFGAQQIVKVVSAAASFPVARIIHDEITTVSSIRRILEAKISVDFGGYTSATAKINYYLNGSSESILVKDKGAVQDQEEFYISLPKFDSGDAKVDYQIQITFKDAYDNTSYLYWPSSSTYQTADIVSYSSGVVTAGSGGTIRFESGNQQYGNTEIVFSSGTFTTDQTITITELSVPSLSPSYSGSVSGTSRMVALYSIMPLWAPALTIPARATFYYGTETTATKFDLMRRDSETDTWEKISDITIDLSSKTISTYITKAGYYAIYTSSNLSDNDYRPAKRVVVQGRAVFKFNNLSEGDSVKIYNINGKRIREIKSGDSEGFKWDGRKNNGSYAESGTYIYQIKVKDKGKLISGTIAFVK
ncbi:MAG: FlgD immunoglobulin-like domain containing protein [Endomicrobiaceae bacterium]